LQFQDEPRPEGAGIVVFIDCSFKYSVATDLILRKAYVPFGHHY